MDWSPARSWLLTPRCAFLVLSMKLIFKFESPMLWKRSSRSLRLSWLSISSEMRPNCAMGTCGGMLCFVLPCWFYSPLEMNQSLLLYGSSEARDYFRITFGRSVAMILAPLSSPRSRLAFKSFLRMIKLLDFDLSMFRLPSAPYFPFYLSGDSLPITEGVTLETRVMIDLKSSGIPLFSSRSLNACILLPRFIFFNRNYYYIYTQIKISKF